MSNIQDCAAMIAADMRALADDIAAGRAIVGQSVWRSYADRVEEVGTGNIAKLREALVAAKKFVDSVGKAALVGKVDAIATCQCAAKLSTRMDAALAEPARNCDWCPTWESAKAAYWREQGDPADWRKLGAWLFAAKEEVRGEGLPRTEQESEVANDKA